jgi:hypothetical protein
MLILDTDLLTIVQRGEGEAYGRLAARLDEAASTQPVCVTIISFEEQMRGWLAYIARQRTAARQVEAYGRPHQLIRDFEDRQVLEIDENAAREFEGCNTFSSGAGWKEVMPREAVLPAPSAATAGSAMLFLWDRIPTPLFSFDFLLA